MSTLNEHPADKAAAPVVGESWNAPGPQQVSRHAHRRGQLIYTARGCVTVDADGFLYVVPAHRALWVPPGVQHGAAYPQEVAFRGIFVAPDLCANLPKALCFVEIDGLARELIEAIVHLPWDYGPDSAEARLTAVLLDRIRALPSTPLSLPDAADDRLRRVTAALRDAPTDARGLAEWASLAGMSQRNFTRRFRTEAGMSFVAWRQQLLVLLAIEKLASGEPVTRIAIDLGFASTSGFTAMFKRTTGIAPSAYLQAGALGAT
ncbi:MAG: helix-turn-helix transcriptional regulator [Pseudomonadota bacterium]